MTMPSTHRTPLLMDAAAGEFAFNNAQWHAQQSRYWRRMKIAKDAAVAPGRCEHHARRHERRVIEIAQQCEAALVSHARDAGATA